MPSIYDLPGWQRFALTDPNTLTPYSSSAPFPVGDAKVAPASSLKAVTPHATNPLPDGVCKGLYVGTAGNLSIVAENDSAAVLLTGVPAGTFVPVRALRVVSPATTAGSIVALY